MYPQRELRVLSFRKQLLRRRIAENRWACAEIGAEVLRPLVSLDGLVEQWRRLTPFLKMAAVPLALVLRRTLFRRMRLVPLAWRLVPLIVQVLRLLPRR